MSTIRIFILWLQWIMFRRPSVIIFDSDGTPSARLAHGFRNIRYAKRYGFGIRTCFLKAGGGVYPESYVRKWEPLFPSDFTV